jgi:hypothetical protein
VSPLQVEPGGATIVVQHSAYTASGASMPLILDGAERAQVETSEFRGGTGYLEVGSNSLVQQNRFHWPAGLCDGRDPTPDLAQVAVHSAPRPADLDAGAANVVIRKNYFSGLLDPSGECGFSSLVRAGVELTPTSGPIQAIRVEANHFLGVGDYMLIARRAPTDETLEDVSVVGNRFTTAAGSRPNGGRINWFWVTATAITRWDDNTKLPLPGPVQPLPLTDGTVE